MLFNSISPSSIAGIVLVLQSCATSLLLFSKSEQDYHRTATTCDVVPVQIEWKSLLVQLCLLYSIT